jgi:hypothetical protein
MVPASRSTNPAIDVVHANSSADSHVKTYIALTTALFGLLTVTHVWRAIVEPSARDPWFIAITVVSALLCVWGSRVFLSVRQSAIRDYTNR